MYIVKGIRGMHESQAIDGSTWKSRQVSESDNEDIPLMPFILVNMLYSQMPINRLQFLVHLLRFIAVCTANQNYLLSGYVIHFNSSNMKPFIKGPLNNPLEVNRN